MAYIFNFRSQLVYDTSVWHPDRRGLAYLEASEYWEKDKTRYDLRQGNIEDDELEAWLDQCGKFRATPKLSIRLLLCDRVGYIPMGFAMSNSSFDKIKQAFSLGDQVLPMFISNMGQEMCSLNFSPEGDVPETLEFTVKWPQMHRLGNCGLTYKHTFSTRQTVGFLHGWDMVTQTAEITFENEFHSYLSKFSSRIESAGSVRSHPMFLAIVHLSMHVFHADIFRARLKYDLGRLENDLGVTKVAWMSGLPTTNFDGIERLISSRRQRMSLTTELNSRTTDTAKFITVLQWINRHCEYIQKHTEDIRRINPYSTVAENREIERQLEYVTSQARSHLESAEEFKSRLELQLSVLYNFVAQVDNDVSMRIAYRAGLDGTAMKALAYVTTIFLPPTFVATLFSMSMFDWQATTNSDSDSDSDSKSVVLVRQFWIYWVVSVPLTLAIFAGWRIWWRYQKSVLQDEYGMKQ
ncbi:hypothetical protein GGS20DRAFT_581558 [Poronia punctata]|nr:hypothetical protein GGS20DRAFT_581558 [Poronia punctata]